MVAMFSALHLFGSYNPYLGSTADVAGRLGAVRCEAVRSNDDYAGSCPYPLPPPIYLPSPASYPVHGPPLLSLDPSPSKVKASSRTGSPRRPRSEKKPIPEEQKDDKYYERRKRNNQAAKKSRDARRIREDQIALRASMLEHENAVLRAQVLTLREESQSLRQLLIRTKNIESDIFHSISQQYHQS